MRVWRRVAVVLGAVLLFVGLNPSASVARPRTSQAASMRRQPVVPASFPGTAYFHVHGIYHPVVGDFDGNGWQDILWYAPGAAHDYVWYFISPSGYVQKDVTVNGDYTPVTGDFNGDGITDILWYAPGPAQDYWWVGNGNQTFTPRATTINGYYRPVSVDLDGDGHIDILWYAPGTAQDYVWFGKGSLTFTSKAVRIDGDYEPVAGSFGLGTPVGDVLLYGPGTLPDEIMVGSAQRTFTFQPINQPGVFTPIVGRFGGVGESDIFWYAPGPALDQAWYSTNHDFAFDIHQGQVEGTGYEPFALNNGIFWYAPAGPSPDTLWVNVRTDFAATEGPKSVTQLPAGDDMESLAPDATDVFVAAGTAAAHGGDVAVDTYSWRQTFGSATHFDAATGVTTDPAGNVYVVGTTEGTIPGSPEHAPGLFVAKFGPSGVRLWIHQHPGFPQGDGAIAYDGRGNLDIAATTWDAQDHAYVLGLIQYDTNGHERWITIDDDVRPGSVGAKIASAPDGSIYTVGLTVQNDAGLIVHYDAAGHRISALHVGATDGARPGALVVDTHGNVDVTGGIAGDVLVAQYTADLAPVWSVRYGEYYADGGSDIVLAPDGTIVVAGQAGQALPGSVGDGLTFIARYTPQGRQLALNQYEFQAPTGLSAAHGHVVFAADNVLVNV